jgi:hypothetical protein
MIRNPMNGGAIQQHTTTAPFSLIETDGPDDVRWVPYYLSFHNWDTK